MRKVPLFGLVLFCLGLLLSCTLNASPPPIASSTASSISATPRPTLQYQTHTLPTSIVHTLLIPAQSTFTVTAAIVPKTATVPEFARQTGAIAVLNAGFFDPVNQKSTSYVVLQTRVVADPKQNDRLMQNPNLTPYLDKILDRTEFRKYQCGATLRYDMALHSQPVPNQCHLVDAVGAGPRLLPQNTAVAEGFVDEANGRDALGSTQPNARTAIGLTAAGDIVWVMAAQKPDAEGASGLTFQELATFMQTLGIEQAMNLDGGSSSSLYYQGQAIYGKVDEAGNPVKRPVKSVLLVSESAIPGSS